MKKLLFCATLLFPLVVGAVLPPLYTSVDEIKGMLESPDLSKVVESGELIMKIVRTSNGFDIETNKSLVHVKVVPVPPKMPGPLTFTYEFSKAVK